MFILTVVADGTTIIKSLANKEELDRLVKFIIEARIREGWIEETAPNQDRVFFHPERKKLLLLSWEEIL